MAVEGFRVALNSFCVGSSSFSTGVGLPLTDGCGREVESKALWKTGLPWRGTGESLGDSESAEPPPPSQVFSRKPEDLPGYSFFLAEVAQTHLLLLCTYTLEVSPERPSPFWIIDCPTRFKPLRVLPKNRVLCFSKYKAKRQTPTKIFPQTYLISVFLFSLLRFTRPETKTPTKLSPLRKWVFFFLWVSSKM